MNAPDFPDRRRPAHHPPVERFNEPVLVLVTVCTKDRRGVLACAEVHGLCRDAWRAAGSWQVGRYVIMPDHIHLFCFPGRLPVPGLRPWVEFWKSRVAVAWARLPDLGGSASARTGSGQGPDAAPRRGKLWQRDFWDTQIRSRDHYAEKAGYVRMNPVRQGLVEAAEQWPYQGEVIPFVWR